MAKDHSQRIVHSSEDPNWRTPIALFNGLWTAARGFTIDLAADAESRLVETYLGPGSPDGEDALAVRWSQIDPGGRGFLNMPYSVKLYRQTKNPAYLIESWVAKCWDEGLGGYETWGVVPFAPQTEWYRRYVMGHNDEGGWSGYAASDVWRLPYRVNFDPSPEYLARIAAEHAAGLRKNGDVGSAGHNVVIAIWRPNPGWVGPWQPAERYWSYR